MVKFILAANQRGLRDWFFQRISAVVMAIYFIGIIAYLLMHPDLDFTSWHGLFVHPEMKIATFLVVVSLLFHAWVGVWTIFTDYVKVAWLNRLLNVLVFFSLVACFFWTLMILWGI